MRTLVGAAEPEPRPPVTYNPQITTTTSTTTTVVWWPVVNVTVGGTAPREPIRTTVYVGKPIPEIEAP